MTKYRKFIAIESLSQEDYVRSETGGSWEES